MRSHLQGQSAARRIRRQDSVDVGEPPGPARMFARLGLLMLIALGFGLAAQLLVGVLH